MHSGHGPQSPGDRKDWRCPDKARLTWEENHPIVALSVVPSQPLDPVINLSHSQASAVPPPPLLHSHSCPVPPPVNCLAPIAASPSTLYPTAQAYTLRETNDGASAERGVCPAHKPQGWVTSGVAMAATTHPSVFPLFCLRPALMASECLENKVSLCLGHLSMPTPTMATFILSWERQDPL